MSQVLSMHLGPQNPLEVRPLDKSWALSSVQILRASTIIVVIPKINPVTKTKPKGQNNRCTKEGRLIFSPLRNARSQTEEPSILLCHDRPSETLSVYLAEALKQSERDSVYVHVCECDCLCKQA